MKNSLIKRKSTTKKGVENWTLFLLSMSIVTGIAIGFWFLKPKTYMVSGYSMSPTLTHHQKIKVSKDINTIHRKDIVIVATKHETKHDNVNKLTTSDGLIVKRIIGLPGDKVESKNGDIYINDKKLDEPYVLKSNKKIESWKLNELHEKSNMWNDNIYNKTTIIPAKNYFVMGDNRSHSIDSRFIGYINKDSIIGIVRG